MFLIKILRKVPIKNIGIVLFFILTILLIYVNRSLLVLTLDSFQLLPRQERFTELYLDEHLDMPTLLEPGETATASFTIHNNEQEKHRYEYQVQSTQGTKTRIISSGTASLHQNEYRSFPFSYSVATSEPKTKVDILLIDKKQSIHFWINNTL